LKKGVLDPMKMKGTKRFLSEAGKI
jgi:hypothetical protein